MEKIGDVEAEYKKNKELSKEDVNLLKDWIEKQPHLPKISEFQIILFLHSCYYRIEPTKTCIESFYTAKSHCPDFFTNRDPVKYENEIFQTFLIAPLQKKTRAGYQIIFCKFINTDVNKFVFSNAIKTLDMVTVLMLHQLGTAPGYVILGDLSGISFGHITKLTPTQLSKFFFYLQEALPIRLKGFLLINIPSFIDKLMALIKPFMKNDLLNCLELYNNNFDGLYKTIPKDCLPNEYGGEAGTIDELIKLKIIFFLHASYYKIEPAKTYIENYYTLKGSWLEFSQNRDINLEPMRHTMRLSLVTDLPVRTKHNHLVVYTRIMDSSLDHFDALQQLKYFDMFVSAVFRVTGLSDGQVGVMDMEGVTFGHLLRINLMDLKRHAYYVQEALPIRIKGLHYINVSPVVDKLLSMIKPFLKKEMASLIHVHTKMDTLYEYVPKEALPNELGGQAATYKELHEENAQYLIEEEAEIDETKRTEISKNAMPFLE
ncbi:alpha-tocopherol transfer protein-related [Holotrichia oblita]|uniref:Alpha-tocopherol transfer protein-related n=1 Tax=Holotrichia oblita TaxID=644536 RepID=A0ACB9SHI0_HOLOL|nr:alpha-tocopherol transfer protein-related [Holotrichia oblita]